MITTIQIFVYPQAWPEHLVWSSILLFLLMRGGGAIAADHAIAHAFAPSPPPANAQAYTR